MTIGIVQRPEPLSSNSFGIGKDAPEPILIGSDAARQLEDELEKYCGGNVSGRSFLIVGHRGSGKSTLVASAFLNIWKKSERATSTALRRPVLVPLNGPSLFPSPPKPGTNNEATNGADGDGLQMTLRTTRTTRTTRRTPRTRTRTEKAGQKRSDTLLRRQRAKRKSSWNRSF